MSMRWMRVCLWEVRFLGHTNSCLSKLNKAQTLLYHQNYLHMKIAMFLLVLHVDLLF